MCLCGTTLALGLDAVAPQEGIQRAKAEDKYHGRPEDVERNSRIHTLPNMGTPWSEVCAITGASRCTLAWIKKVAAEGAES